MNEKKYEELIENLSLKLLKEKKQIAKALNRTLKNKDDIYSIILEDKELTIITKYIKKR